MNKEDIENRIAELTRKWESNQVKIMQIQQELQRQLEIDQSIRGGISELKRLIKVPETPE